MEGGRPRPPYRPRIHIFTGLLLGLTLPALALEVTLDVQPRTIQFGESATCMVTIFNVTNPPKPDFPAIDGLEFQYRGMRSSSTWRNGRSSRTTTYQYTLTPLKTGRYTLGPFNYTARGITVATSSVQINVVPRGKTAEPDKPQQVSDFVFVTVDTPSTKIYSQQTFELFLSIYSRELTLSNKMGLHNMPESGFKINEFQEVRGKREVINNQTFNVRRFRSKARALTTGTFTINPTIRLNVVLPRAGRNNRFDPFFERFDGFFGTRETRQLDVETKPLNLTVLPLPEAGKPDSFAGAVGRFEYKVNLAPTTLAVGDPVTIRTEIRGVGNMDTVMAPTVEAHPGFKTYEAKLLKNELNAEETEGTRTFEQVIIPLDETMGELSPLRFSFFDPEKAAYREIVQGPFALSLTASSNQVARIVMSDDVLSTLSGRKKVLGEDIVYLKAHPEKWYARGAKPWYVTRTFVGAQLLPPVFMAISLLVARRRERLQSDQALARRVQAPRHARAALKKADAALARQDAPAFYEALWQALADYFGDRLNLAAGEISTENVCGLLREKGLPDEENAALETLFATCMERRYAGSASDGDPGELNALKQQLTRLLKECERLKK